jgi:transposase
MPQPHISTPAIRKLLNTCAADDFNKTQTARRLRISRSSAKKYINAFKRSSLTLSEIDSLPRARLIDRLFPASKHSTSSPRKLRLLACLPSIHSRIEIDGLSISDAWREAANQCDYKYSQFTSLYAAWRLEHGFGRISRAKRPLRGVSPTDCAVLTRWQRSHDRRKWEVSVALLGLSSGHTVPAICKKITRARRTVEKWCATYERLGIDGLPVKRSRKLSEKVQTAIKEKKVRLIKIIHETPNAHSINRASWSLQALSQAYEKTYGEHASRSSVSEYFIAAGYKFKKAKKSLMSSDPTYREKLDKITSTLSRLSSNERFFSIDEFGPFSVRMHGGTALVPGDQIRTIPQRQRSRGSLICTAALELSSNQILHFYSKKKNSKEMIKLLRRLIIRYRDQKRIFVSWDSASWHASKMLYRIVDEMNCDEFTSRHKTPIVELIPLPSGAQFLNVIESVFSGMARAILHNSNYGNVDECKSAINLYFADRNRAFLERPRRAGNKIWGKEQVEPVFKEENNCKDPRWR